MDATLSLASEGLADEDLQRLTRELRTTLNRETPITADLAEAPAEPGARGGGEMLFTLALTFLSSGAAVAMFQVAKVYFERNASLKLQFKRADGQELMIDETNLRPDQIDSTLRFAREFFGEAG